MSTSQTMKLSAEQRRVLCEVYTQINFCDRKLKSIGYDKDPINFDKQVRGTFFEIHRLVKSIKFRLKHLGIDEDHQAMNAGLAKMSTQIAGLGTSIAAMQEVTNLQRGQLDHLNSKFNVASSVARH